MNYFLCNKIHNRLKMSVKSFCFLHLTCFWSLFLQSSSSTCLCTYMQWPCLNRARTVGRKKQYRPWKWCNIDVFLILLFVTIWGIIFLKRELLNVYYCIICVLFKLHVYLFSNVVCKWKHVTWTLKT